MSGGGGALRGDEGLARTLGCAACGARFPIARPEAAVVCPYCQHQQPVPAALRRELGTFRDQFGAEQRQADADAAHADAWREAARTHRPLEARSILLLQAALVLPLLLAIGAAKLVPEASAAPIVVCVVLYAAAFAGLWRRRASGASGRRPRGPARADLGIHEISCPACGAPQSYDPRGSHMSCGFCQSALFPGPAVIEQSLDAARRGKRAALLERYRAERAGAARVALGLRAQRSGGVARYQTALFLSLASSGVLLAGTLDRQLEGALLALWLLVPLPLLLAWRRARRDQARRARLEAALGLVARQGGGVADDDVAAFVAWLDRHWAGPHELPHDTLGAWFHSLRLAVGPYPALIELNLDPRAPGIGNVDALLAAWVPGVSDSDAPRPGVALPEAARPWLDRLSALGWSLKITPAGLVARLDQRPGALRGLLDEPESATSLTGALAQLAGVARCLGASGAAR